MDMLQSIMMLHTHTVIFVPSEWSAPDDPVLIILDEPGHPMDPAMLCLVDVDSGGLASQPSRFQYAAVA